MWLTPQCGSFGVSISSNRKNATLRPLQTGSFYPYFVFCSENVFNYLSFWWENSFPRGWDVGGEEDSLLLGTFGSVVVIGLHRTSGKWTGRLIPFYGKITHMNLPFERPLETRRVFTECCSCIYKASLDSHLPESLLPTPLPPIALLLSRAKWQQRESPVRLLDYLASHL